MGFGVTLTIALCVKFGQLGEDSIIEWLAVTTGCSVYRGVTFALGVFAGHSVG